jgi:phosphoribosylformimino-5-aminoimidazole carboxamide ribotide isomerase
MHIIPVLDILAGQVVRGIAGRRSTYRPIVSRLTASTDPRDIAQAFADHFSLSEFYLADLDAIAGGVPAWAIYDRLQRAGFRLWVDAGVKEHGRAAALAAASVAKVVVGLETIAGPHELGEIVTDLGAARTTFSLDLHQGQVLGDASGWETTDAWAIAARAIGLGVRYLIVLDLAHVGMGGGTGTEHLCGRLSAAFPAVQVAAGGGIRGRTDLERLSRCGVQAALVASALHDGQLRPEDWSDL